MITYFSIESNKGKISYWLEDETRVRRKVSKKEYKATLHQLATGAFSDQYTRFELAEGRGAEYYLTSTLPKHLQK